VKLGERRRFCGLGVAIAAAIIVASPALAANKASNSNSILPGGSSKEPISIDADKLVYFDKEQKAIYTGNVIAIQGDSKLTCSALTIFLAKNETPAADAGGQSKGASAQPKDGPTPASAVSGDGPNPASSQVKHMEASGPVTVVSKTQVATGDRGVYDKGENKVWLFGNVTLTDGGNVTKGDKLTYDLTTGQAVVEAGHSAERIHALFIPGSNDNNNNNADKSAPAKKKLPDNGASKQ
jgi:lipopolysaccharide export system protein LptA